MKTKKLEFVPQSEIVGTIQDMIARQTGRGKQARVARIMDMSESTLSRVLNGHFHESAGMLKYLGLKVRKVYVRANDNQKKE